MECGPYCECAIDEQCPGWHEEFLNSKVEKRGPTPKQKLQDMLEWMEGAAKTPGQESLEENLPILTPDQIISIDQSVRKYESFMGRPAYGLEQRALREMALRPVLRPVSTPEAGVKYDHGKVRWDLFPPGPLEEIGKVLTFGATKYDDDNWKKVDGWKRRYFAASMRHLWAYWKGEGKDPETGLSHLAHAMCCIIFLLGKEMEKEE